MRVKIQSWEPAAALFTQGPISDLYILLNTLITLVISNKTWLYMCVWLGCGLRLFLLGSGHFTIRKKSRQLCLKALGNLGIPHKDELRTTQYSCCLGYHVLRAGGQGHKMQAHCPCVTVYSSRCFFQPHWFTAYLLLCKNALWKSDVQIVQRAVRNNGGR